jgi:hypothetical protein
MYITDFDISCLGGFHCNSFFVCFVHVFLKRASRRVGVKEIVVGFGAKI